MDQIRRIEEMEIILDEAAAALQDLEASLDRYRALRSRLRRLEEYYESPLWMQDFRDDEAQKLPGSLKRGVLSEDGIYNLLSDEARLLEEMKELAQ